MLTAQMVAYLVKLALLNAVKRVSLSPPPPCRARRRTRCPNL